MSSSATSIRVSLYPPAARWAAAAFHVLALLTLLGVAALVVLDMFQGDMLMPPLKAFRTLVAFALLPEIAARLLARIYDARLEAGADALTLTRAAPRELRRAAVSATRPWRVPLPTPGATLTLGTGERLHLGCRRVRDLESAFGPLAPGLLTRVVATRPGKSRLRRALELGVVPLVLGLVFFRTHQVIAYGAFNGEYYQHGLWTYLGTLARVIAETATLLVLYLAVVRAAGELVAVAGTAVARSRAGTVRQVVEVALALAYWVLLPALVVARFLA